MELTISQQQTISAILTAVMGVFGVSAAASTTSGNTTTTLVSLICAGIVALINHFQTATTASTTASTPVVVKSTTASVVFDPGFTVTPTSPELKSGESVTLNVITGVATTSLTIDWLDGNIEAIPLTQTSAGKVASPTHKYTYVQGASQYTGHTYYPKFTISNGVQVKVFNDVANGQGAACAVGVSA
jgi:hypothetical protein